MQQNSFVHQESKEKVHKDIFNQEIAFFHLSFPHWTGGHSKKDYKKLLFSKLPNFASDRANSFSSNNDIQKDNPLTGIWTP